MLIYVSPVCFWRTLHSYWVRLPLNFFSFSCDLCHGKSKNYFKYILYEDHQHISQICTFFIIISSWPIFCVIWYNLICNLVPKLTYIYLHISGSIFTSSSLSNINFVIQPIEYILFILWRGTHCRLFIST